MKNSSIKLKIWRIVQNRHLVHIAIMKTVFGMFDGVVSADGSRVSERMQTRTPGESVRVYPSDVVSELASESPASMRELVSEFLPVPTK